MWGARGDTCSQREPPRGECALVLAGRHRSPWTGPSHPLHRPSAADISSSPRPHPGSCKATCCVGAIGAEPERLNKQVSQKSPELAQKRSPLSERVRMAEATSRGRLEDRVGLEMLLPGVGERMRAGRGGKGPGCRTVCGVVSAGSEAWPPAAGGVLKHGFSFERKDASFFFPLKAVTWLSMAWFGPGTHHKDICVSFGAVCQAHRLPRLSAHLPYGGQSPSFCQPKATGRLSGNRDSLAAAAAAGPGLGVTSGLHGLWLPGSRGQEALPNPIAQVQECTEAPRGRVVPEVPQPGRSGTRFRPTSFQLLGHRRVYPT
ncbi:unnamed protein product [Rangifer tarandus platyrhynchus]|uniref:Uncharacterized protein n=1 Tax=Rangifer tarandus platyrhynchus TaxID=3082113 RepID=A0ABN8ZFY5_RANTA|nr:unnamed protein product [Rangifer tarandus platyrhynchus]